MTTAMQALGGIVSVGRFLDDTDYMADWPVFTEQEYVELTLRFANVRIAEDISELSSIYFELAAAGHLADDDRTDFPDSPDTIANLRKAQRKLVEWLETIRLDPSGAAVRLGPVVQYAFDRMVIRPKRSSVADSFEVRSRYYPDNLQAAFGYALNLILKNHQFPSWRRLCRCKYSACQRFFMEVKASTGIPRRVYCSKDHFNAERFVTRAQRMRTYRANKRAQALLIARRRAK